MNKYIDHNCFNEFFLLYEIYISLKVEIANKKIIKNCDLHNFFVIVN